MNVVAGEEICGRANPLAITPDPHMPFTSDEWRLQIATCCLVLLVGLLQGPTQVFRFRNDCNTLPAHSYLFVPSSPAGSYIHVIPTWTTNATSSMPNTWVRCEGVSDGLAEVMPISGRWSGRFDSLGWHNDMADLYVLLFSVSDGHSTSIYREIHGRGTHFFLPKVLFVTLK